jgi:hypothetical protein
MSLGGAIVIGEFFSFLAGKLLLPKIGLWMLKEAERVGIKDGTCIPRPLQALLGTLPSGSATGGLLSPAVGGSSQTR